MRVLELHSIRERPGLIDEWRRLWSEQETAPVFVHPTWARSWWRHFGHGRHLRLLGVEEAGRLVALAPLFLERPYPVPGRLRIIGAGVTDDFQDWLLPADPATRLACASALFDHLAVRRGWMTLEIQGLRPDSRMLPLLDHAEARGLLVRPRPGPRTPVVPLADTWDAYLKTRGGNVRRNLGKKQRRLARLGDVQYVHATPTSAAGAVDEVIRLHDLRWTGRNDVTLVSRSADGQAFYREVLPKLVAEGIADVVTLELDGRAIAAQVGFEVGDTYFNYQAAFDPAQAPYSPSTLLLAYLLERAWDRGLRTFDFMTGDEPYKSDWAVQTPSVTHVTVLPDQSAARLVVGAMEVGRHLRDLREQASAGVTEPTATPGDPGPRRLGFRWPAGHVGAVMAMSGKACQAIGALLHVWLGA